MLMDPSAFGEESLVIEWADGDRSLCCPRRPGDVWRRFLCLFLKSTTVFDHEGGFCLIPTRLEPLHVNIFQNLTVLRSYSLQISVIELWRRSLLTVQCNCGSSSSFSMLSPLTGINFKEVAPENTKAIFGEIHTSIDTLAFTFGNVWVQGWHLIPTLRWFEVYYLQCDFNYDLSV